MVSLDRYYDDGRIVRMIQLSKLSGVKVNRPSYLFTLDGGVFQSFSTYNPLGDTSPRSRGLVMGEQVTQHGIPRAGRGVGRHAALRDDHEPEHGRGRQLRDGPCSCLSGILGRGGSRSRSTLFRPFEGIGLEQAKGALGEVTPIQQTKGAGGREAKGLTESLRAQVEKERKVKHAKKVVLLAGSDFVLNAMEEDGQSLIELMKSRDRPLSDSERERRH